MTDDFEATLARLGRCRSLGHAPQMTRDQLQSLLAAAMAGTRLTPIRRGGQDDWSERRVRSDPLTPAEVLGLCHDAIEHRFAVNLRADDVTEMIDELRHSGVDVSAYDRALRRRPR